MPLTLRHYGVACIRVILSPGYLTAFLADPGWEGPDGADPERGDRAVKERDRAGAPGGSARGGARAAGSGPARAVSLPRGQDAVSRDHACEEPLALLGRVPGGRHGDRLGDACGRGVVPPRGGALAE